jgi:hypothetical protein
MVIEDSSRRVVNVSASGSAVAGAAAISAMVVAISGCGTAASRQVARLVASPTLSPSPPQKHYAHGTGRLRMAVTPTTGPVGTEVTIAVTGCGDPDGHNHAVSFNPGFANTLQAAHANYHMASIASQLAGQTLTATYRISTADAAAAAHPPVDAPPPQFYVQCSDDLVEATFVITP